MPKVVIDFTNWHDHVSPDERSSSPKLVSQIMEASGLGAWWSKAFSEDQRNYINYRYRSDFIPSQEKLTHFLNVLFDYLNRKGDRPIAAKVLEMAIAIEERLHNDILELHFSYGRAIELYSKMSKKDAVARERFLEYCHKQIAIQAEAARLFSMLAAQKAVEADPSRLPFVQSVEFLKKNLDSEPRQLPNHTGYLMLISYYEQLGDYVEVLRYARQAKEQKWCWGGQYLDQVIQRCEAKLLH
jgi:hypothetical protein